MQLPLKQALELASCSRDDFNNWFRRGLLALQLDKPTPKAPNRLSKDSVRELVYTSALVGVGFSPSTAASQARSLLDAPTPVRWFICNPATKESEAFTTDCSSMKLEAVLGICDDTFEGELLDGGEMYEPPMSAARVNIIHLAELDRRIDEYFSRHSRQAEPK